MRVHLGVSPSTVPTKGFHNPRRYLSMLFTPAARVYPFHYPFAYCPPSRSRNHGDAILCGYGIQPIGILLANTEWPFGSGTETRPCNSLRTTISHAPLRIASTSIWEPLTTVTIVFKLRSDWQLLSHGNVCASSVSTRLTIDERFIPLAEALVSVLTQHYSCTSLLQCKDASTFILLRWSLPDGRADVRPRTYTD